MADRRHCPQCGYIDVADYCPYRPRDRGPRCLRYSPKGEMSMMTTTASDLIQRARTILGATAPAVSIVPVEDWELQLQNRRALRSIFYKEKGGYAFPMAGAR